MVVDGIVILIWCVLVDMFFGDYEIVFVLEEGIFIVVDISVVESFGFGDGVIVDLVVEGVLFVVFLVMIGGVFDVIGVVLLFVMVLLFVGGVLLMVCWMCCG